MHAILESTLFLVNAESGIVLSCHETVLKGTSAEAAKSAETPAGAPSAVPRLRPLAQCGRSHSAYMQEAVHLAVLESGIAVNAQLGRESFLCFPIRSPFVSSTALGVIVVAGKIAPPKPLTEPTSESATEPTEPIEMFTAQDENRVETLGSHALGFVFGCYPVDSIRQPYDAKLLHHGMVTPLPPLMGASIACAASDPSGMQRIVRTTSLVRFAHQGMLLTANVPIAQQLLELGAYVSQLEDVLADQRSQRRKFEEANAAAEAKVQRLQQSVSALARENARLRQVNETQAAAAQSFREEVDQQLVLRVVNRDPPEALGGWPKRWDRGNESDLVRAIRGGASCVPTPRAPQKGMPPSEKLDLEVRQFIDSLSRRIPVKTGSGGGMILPNPPKKIQVPVSRASQLSHKRPATGKPSLR